MNHFRAKSLIKTLPASFLIKTKCKNPLCFTAFLCNYVSKYTNLPPTYIFKQWMGVNCGKQPLQTKIRTERQGVFACSTQPISIKNGLNFIERPFLQLFEAFYKAVFFIRRLDDKKCRETGLKIFAPVLAIGPPPYCCFLK